MSGRWRVTRRGRDHRANGRVGAVQRTLLITAALVVAGAVVALVIWLRSGSGADPAQSGTRVANKSDADTGERTPAAPLAKTERPEIERSPPPVLSKRGERKPPVREYVNERGVMVRDYRTGDHPDFNPEVVASPRKQEVEPRVVKGVQNSVYDAVRECRKSVDPEAYGDKPRAQAEIVVSVEDGQASADKALIKMADIDEAAGKEFATCIQQQAKQLAFAADGHKKVSQYRITLIFPLR